MKKIISTISVMLLAIATLSAQPQQNQQGRQGRPTEGEHKNGNFTEFQTQVLTKQLHLEEQKREAFIKLYTEYSQKMELLQPKQEPQRRSGAPNAPQGERPAKPTDAEVEAKILESFEMAEKGTALKREYYDKFKTILTPHQILKMYNIERRLRERIVSESNRRTKEE